MRILPLILALSLLAPLHADPDPGIQAAEQISKGFRAVARSAGPGVVSVSPRCR